MSRNLSVMVSGLLAGAVGVSQQDHLHVGWHTLLFSYCVPPHHHHHHHCCRDLDNIGTTYLANKLSNHLINEITRKLPDIQSYVDKT
jgi:hypothetical protein